MALRNNAKTLSKHLKKQKKRAKVSEKFDLVQKVLPAIAEKTSSVVGKPVPNLDKVVAAIMDVVWIEEEIEFSNGNIEIEIKIINYRLRSANFKLRAEVPGHEIKEAEPRPGKREGNHVIWSVGLPTTESAKYKFIVPQANRSSFEGLELWVEGIDLLILSVLKLGRELLIPELMKLWKLKNKALLRWIYQIILEKKEVN